MSAVESAARDLWDRTRQRTGSVALALAVTATVVAVAMGSGYSASRSFLSDGSAWLARGKRLVHVNGVTGRPDAEVARDLAAGNEVIQVVQTDGGNVYVVNKSTNEVYRLDLSKMDVDREGHRAPGGPPQDLDLLTGGGQTYIVHRGDGRVETVDPLNLAVRDSVTLDGGIQGSVIDGSGAVWAVTGQGMVVRVRGSRIEVELETAAPGSALSVALVGDTPVVADQAAGTVRRIDPARGTAEEPIRLPGDPGQVVLNGAGNPGPWLWAMQGNGALVRVDLVGGTVETVALGQPGGSFGPPIVNGGRVYVPDYAHHAVVSVHADSLQVAATSPVSGTSPRFDVFVKDQAVWVNDPTGPTTVVIPADGKVRVVGKGGAGGAGDGAADEVAQAEPPPVAPPPPAPPARPKPPRPLPAKPPAAPKPLLVGPPAAPAVTSPASPPAPPAAAPVQPAAPPRPSPPTTRPSPPTTRPAPAPAPAARDRLDPDQRLDPGQRRVSADGRFDLIMQGDGNLVLYAPGGRALWASRTVGNPGAWAIMQSDGNLVVYRRGQPPVPSAALWASRTAGHPGAWAVMQNDGNFVVYRPGSPTPPRALWATNTCCR